MKKLLLLITIVAVSFSACNKPDNKPIEEPKATTIDSAKVVEMQKEEKVVDRLQETPYMNFVKDIKIVGKVAIILFCDDYGEYQTIHPNDPLTSDEYRDFWEDHERVKMAFSTIPLKLFTDNSDIDVVDLSLSHLNMKFYLNIDRTAFFEIIGEIPQEISAKEYFEANRDKSDILFEEKIKKMEK